jgi:hypothetical protein
VEGKYSMQVHLREPESYLELFAYVVDQFTWQIDKPARPPPIRLPEFLAPLLRPILQKVSKLQITFRNRAEVLPIDSVLSLLPTTSDSVHEVIDIVLVGPSKDLVNAMSTFPFHAKVCLNLQDPQRWHRDRIEAQFLNDNLRAYQYLCHLAVPCRLSSFESTTVSFSSNAAFESLTLNARWDAKFSCNMLHGIVCNKNLKQLTIVLHCQMKPENAQDILEQLCAPLRSHSVSSRSLTRVHFSSEPNGSHKFLMQSSHAWDCKFAPALVLNWINGQRESLSSDRGGSRLAGLTVRAINRGVAVAKATNVVSRDRSVSSASAIFGCLRRVLLVRAGKFRGGDANAGTKRKVLEE